MSATKRKIFLVDDSVSILTLGRDILSDTYELYTFESCESMFEFLEKVTPDLIILDVKLPGMNGYEAMEKLKSSRETADIPVIFLTSNTDEQAEVHGFSLGAVDFIGKPISGPRLLKRIAVQLIMHNQKKELEQKSQELLSYTSNLENKVTERTQAVENLKNAFLSSIAELVEHRDNITGGHILRTREYVHLLLHEIDSRSLFADELAGIDLELAVISSQMHDIGKISINDAILLKEGSLTTDEFDIMKDHSSYGKVIIEQIEEKTEESEFLSYAKIFAEYHHEKYDGTGYPHGLRGNDIPLLGRVMALADVYDALVTVRPYKEPISHEEAVEIIRESSGKSFDPVLVELFLDLHEKFAETSTACKDS